MISIVSLKQATVQALSLKPRRYKMVPTSPINQYLKGKRSVFCMLNML